MVSTKIPLLISFAVAIGWTLEKPATEQRSDDDSVAARVRAAAKGANAIMPKNLGEGMIMRSARAQGTTLILALDGLPQWEPTYTTAEMAKMMGVTACEHPGFRLMVKRGADIRIEAKTPGGATLPPLHIDHCG